MTEQINKASENAFLVHWYAVCHAYGAASEYVTAYRAARAAWFAATAGGAPDAQLSDESAVVWFGGQSYGMGNHSDSVPAPDVEGLKASITPCNHLIADARNPFVDSGYVCVECGAIFAAADHDAPKGAVPAFIYTGQQGRELEGDFEGYTHGTKFYTESSTTSPTVSESDAYHYACEIMEEGQRERAKRGVEIGTEGSLCDGVAWLFARIKELEETATKQK